MSELGESIIRGLKQAILYQKGNPEGATIHHFPKVPEDVDVKAIRTKLHMTQEEFAQFGFSVSAIRHWENHRRTPEGAARVLLKVIEHHPEMVLDTILHSHL